MEIVKNHMNHFLNGEKFPPERGQFIRSVGNAFRDYKDALGSLVSLEMGKITRR